MGTGEFSNKSVCIPYVENDIDGSFTSMLIESLHSSGGFKYCKSNSKYILKVCLDKNIQNQIGYRQDVKGELKKRDIVGTENRIDVIAKVFLIDRCTKKIICGPKKVQISVDYDYVDPNSLTDVSFLSGGIINQITPFSLGQLEGVDTAAENAKYRLYHKLSEKIVDVISAEW